MAKVMLVCPVSEAEHYRQIKAVLEKAFERVDATLMKPDYDATNPRFDLEAVKAAMGSVALVVVDLSYERPSCYYELGLAEAVGANVLLVAKRGTPLHQTSLRDRVRFFSDPIEIVETVLASLAK